MMKDVDAIFRAHMRNLGRRGGEATKKLAAADPGYYRRIGWYGGKASAAARRAQIAGSLERGELDDLAIDEPPERPEPAPAVLPRTLTLADIITDADECAPAPRPTEPEDPIAEESFRRFLAHARREEPTYDDEPWSKWD